MKYFVLLATIFISGIFSYPSDQELQTQWRNFKQFHQKSYNKLEEPQRFQIFKNNLRKIEEHNKLYEQYEVSYQMAVNQFADLTSLEFLQYFKTHKYNDIKYSKAVKFQSSTSSEIPDEIDWREKGAVTEVKSQGICTGWVYDVAGALEGQNFLKTGDLIPLSVEELAECVGAGCTGGFVDDGYQYVKDHGLSAEADYPSDPSDGTCHRGSIPSAVTEQGYVLIVGDEETLRGAVGTIGPISVGVDASNWQFYTTGIFSDMDCSSTNLNHDVLVVGYGAVDGDDYWLLKNSWGTSWGEDGYIRMARNTNYNCGITEYPTYPIV